MATETRSSRATRGAWLSSSSKARLQPVQRLGFERLDDQKNRVVAERA